MNCGENCNFPCCEYCPKYVRQYSCDNITKNNDVALPKKELTIEKTSDTIIKDK